MSHRDTGGLDADGTFWDASFECDDCGIVFTWPVTPGVAPIDDPFQVDMLTLIREHEDGGCSPAAAAPSDVSVAQFLDYPRNLYLNAEDFKKANPGLHDKALDVIRNQRYGLFRNVNARAEDFGSAVKALKAFDRTGNIGSAVRHVEDTFRDLKNSTRELIEDIEAAEIRHQQACIVLPAHGQPTKPAADAEPSPGAPTAAAPTNTTPPPGPKPGPGRVHVRAAKS